METTATTAPTVAETVPETEETQNVTETTVPETTDYTVPETTVPPVPTETVYDDYYWDDLPGDDLPEATEDATEPILIIEDTEISEPTENTDISAILVQIEENTALTAEASGLIAGFSLFNVVVILCFFVYRFFRIFF